MQTPPKPLGDGRIRTDRNGNPPLYGTHFIDRRVIEGECVEIVPIDPRSGKMPVGESPSVGEFSVYQFFFDNTDEQVLRSVDAKTAVSMAKSLTTSVGGRVGTTVRVIIIDGGDMINFEWKYGEGVTYPPQIEGSPHAG